MVRWFAYPGAYPPPGWVADKINQIETGGGQYLETVVFGARTVIYYKDPEAKQQQLDLRTIEDPEVKETLDYTKKYRSK